MTTKPLTTITRATCRTLDEEMREALQSVADKYGLSIVPKAGSYSATGFTFKCELKVMTEDGAPADFARKAKLIGIPEDCHGATFISRGVEYVVTDINLKAPKFPVSAKRTSDDQTFGFTPAAVQLGLVKRKAS